MEAEQEPRIVVETDERAEGVIARLIVSNPRKLNCLDAALMDAFASALTALAGEGRLRAIVVTGAGSKAFIGGADIAEMGSIADDAAARGFITQVHRCCDAVRTAPVPVIARIEGYALGAGLEIAASCDIRIAAETAILGMPEVKLGIPSVVEAALLPSLVGWGRAREMMYLGETFTAQEALSWGLVEHVVPAAALDRAVAAWLDKLLTAKPRAVRLQKRLMRQWEELPFKAAIERGVDVFASAYQSDEPATAMRAFLAARKLQKRP